MGGIRWTFVGWRWCFEFSSSSRFVFRRSDSYHDCAEAELWISGSFSIRVRPSS